MRQKTIHQAVYQGLVTGEFFSNWRWQMLVSHEFSTHGQFLSVGRIKLRNLLISASSWQSLTSDLLLSNLRRVVGHIKREHNIYDFNGGFDLYEKNTGTCRDTLANGHWEELIGEVKELLHATDHPDNNYRMVIRQIIRNSSDGEQCLESFLKLHVRKRVRDVIGVIECEWPCINPCRHCQTGHGGYTGG